LDGHAPEAGIKYLQIAIGNIHIKLAIRPLHAPSRR